MRLAGACLKVCEDTTRLDRNGVVGRIEVPNLIQSFKTENDLIGFSHSAATEAGISSLWNDRRFF